MLESYPTTGGEVKHAPGRSVRLNFSVGTVPHAYIPVEAVAPCLGVSVQQVNDFCSSGALEAALFDGKWWITAASLQSFVARASWQLVAPPV